YILSRYKIAAIQPRRISQDMLEGLFGTIRELSGDSSTQTLQGYGHALNKYQITALESSEVKSFNYGNANNVGSGMHFLSRRDYRKQMSNESNPALVSLNLHSSRLVTLSLLSQKIFETLLQDDLLMGRNCVFSRLSTHTTGILDFNCYCVETLILVIEVKRKHILEGIKEQAFPEFYQASEKARMVIQQIYNYMGENKLRYGILTTYDNHWFLCQEHTELWVSKTLPLEPKSPPVLKAYAYLTQQAKENPNSPHPLQVPVQAHGNNNSYVLQSQLKLSSNQSANQQTTPSTLFHGDTIVLKSVDLSKAPPYVLEEMQKEVEIYKDLADIQGKYIPKLLYQVFVQAFDVH
ncbi:4888_t:CDS:2, partial [Entrophospora sp. SA101]